MNWQITLEHCPGGCHSHPLTAFEGVSSGVFTAPDHSHPSHLKLVLTVTDSGGTSGVDELLYYPETVDLEFASEPTGVELGVGDVSWWTPFLKTMLVNSVFTVSAPAYSTVTGALHKFDSWSDGGALSHEITAPPAAVVYTAFYFPACGDGVLDDGEACDDGNTAPGDCCAPDCSLSPAGAPCADDGIPCTVGTCDGAGACEHLPDDGACADSNPCTDDVCDPVTGCQHTPNGLPCDDGDACTTGDTCTGGGCAGGAPLACGDGNPCTDDLCDPLTGCEHPPNQLPCDDENACTTGDTCAGGGCVGGAPLVCGDSNLCTDDLCHTLTGCEYPPNQLPCDDGDACTTGDT